jgi:hypothetical protein
LPPLCGKHYGIEIGFFSAWAPQETTGSKKGVALQRPF